MSFSEPLIRCSGFDRPNLYLEVHPKTSQSRVVNAIFKDLSKTMIAKGSQWGFSGPTIVYTITKAATEKIAQILKGISHLFKILLR